MPALRILHILKTAVFKFIEDDVVTLAASLAFFTTLSLAPLLVILFAVAGLLGEGALAHIIDQIETLLGPTAREGLQLVISNLEQHQETGTISAIVGLVVLLFSATAVFAQLQKSMNKIWNVEPTPDLKVKEELIGWLRKRLVSLGMVVAIGFLLMVSLAVSAALNYFLKGTGSIWMVVNFGVTLVVFIVLFGLIFKVLPDVYISWRDVGIGATITAVLFDVGKWAIGKYLGYSSIGSAYGAAGSLVILLFWVYYNSLIVFLGAEITQVAVPSLKLVPDKNVPAKPRDDEKRP
jgi:membrane protein